MSLRKRDQSTAPQKETARAIDDEPFINADQAAEFLSWNRLRVIREARKGNLPAHPYPRGRGRDWFFRKSELVQVILTGVKSQPRPFVPEQRSER